jgi:predicted dehydrogenase
MAQIKLGFIGCGGHSTGSLQPNLTVIDEIDYVAACDLDQPRAQKAARRFGALNHYTDYKEMIRKEALDAVAIVGPPNMHHAVGLDCLNEGVHILVEKPPAMTAQGAKELAEAAKRTGKMGMVATMWRHQQAHVLMKQFMSTPDFGKPFYFQARFLAPGPTTPIWGYETVEKSYLIGQGVHLIDCTRFLMGDIAQVYCIAGAAREGAISLSITLRFASGATGVVGLASATPVLEVHLLAAGDGREMVEVFNHDRLRAFKKQSWCGTPGGYTDFPSLEWNPGSYYRGFARHGYLEELRHFAQAIASNTQPRASLEDGYQAMRVLEAIEESRVKGVPVNL